MADFSARVLGCEDDCEGERGERGHRGHDGTTGATGATGPAGPGLPAAAGFFIPTLVGPAVTIQSQSGQFESAVYSLIGAYTITLNPIPGLVSSDQIIPVATVSFASGAFIAAVSGFSGGQGFISIRIRNPLDVPIDLSFHLHVDLLGL